MSTRIYVYIIQINIYKKATEKPWLNYYKNICNRAVPVLKIIIAAKNKATNLINFSLFISILLKVL